MAGVRQPAVMPMLLKCSEEEFSQTVSNMDPRVLLETISGLQQEMRREQEQFNSFSQELGSLRDKSSQQYKQISKDLMASQTRLTMLMNRSMKCFSQQSSRIGGPAQQGSPAQFYTLPRSKTNASRQANASANVTPEARVNVVSQANKFNSISNSQNKEAVHENIHVNYSGAQTLPRKTHSQQVHPQSTARGTMGNSQRFSITQPEVNDTRNVPNHSDFRKPRSYSQGQGEALAKHGTHLSHSSRVGNSTENLVNHSSGSDCLNSRQEGPNSMTSKKVYKIPQVSALRQTFESGNRNGTNDNGKNPSGTSKYKKVPLSSNKVNGVEISSENGDDSDEVSKSKQTFRTSVQIAPTKKTENTTEKFGGRPLSAAKTQIDKSGGRPLSVIQSASELPSERNTTQQGIKPVSYSQLNHKVPEKYNRKSEDPKQDNSRKVGNSASQSHAHVSNLNNLPSTVNNSNSRTTNVAGYQSNLKKVHFSDQSNVQTKSSHFVNSDKRTPHQSNPRDERPVNSGIGYENQSDLRNEKLVNSTNNSLKVKGSEDLRLPTTSIDDVVVTETSDQLLNSSSPSRSSPNAVSTVNRSVDDDQRASTSDSDFDHVTTELRRNEPPGENSCTSTPLNPRLERLRQGPQLNRTRLSMEPTISSTQDTGPAGSFLGSRFQRDGGLDTLRSSLRERKSLLPAENTRNPFTDMHKHTDFWSTLPSASRTAQTKPPSDSGFKYMQQSFEPAMPKFEEVHVSSTLERVRKMMKQKSSVMEENAQPAHAPISRFEAIIQRRKTNGSISSRSSVCSDLEDKENDFDDRAGSQFGSSDDYSRVNGQINETSPPPNGHLPSEELCPSPNKRQRDEEDSIFSFRHTLDEESFALPLSPVSTTSSGGMFSGSDDLSGSRNQSRFKTRRDNVDGSASIAEERLRRAAQILDESRRIFSTQQNGSVRDTQGKYDLSDNENETIETVHANVDNSREFKARDYNNDHSQQENTVPHNKDKDKMSQSKNSGSDVPTSQEVMANEAVKAKPGMRTKVREECRAVKKPPVEKPSKKTQPSTKKGMNNKSETKSNRGKPKKLPQIAMFENLGKQNKSTEDKPLRRGGTRGKNADPAREKVVQKMLYGKSPELSPRDEATETDSRTVPDSQKLSETTKKVNSNQCEEFQTPQNDLKQYSGEDSDKPVRLKSASPSSSGKASPVNRMSPRIGKTDKQEKTNGRSSPRDKSGTSSPHSRSRRSSQSGKSDQSSARPARGKSTDQNSPRPARGKSTDRNSPRSRRNSLERGSSSSRRNSTCSTDLSSTYGKRGTTRVEDKQTLSSFLKMSDKAKSRSKPDLLDEKPPLPSSKFQRSKSVGKADYPFDTEDKPETKTSYLRKASAGNINVSPKSKPKGRESPQSGKNRKDASSPSASSQNSQKDKQDLRGRQNNWTKKPETVSSSLENNTVSDRNNSNAAMSDGDSSQPRKPVGGWEFIYVGPKETKSDEVKRLIDKSREQRGVELTDEDPDVIPVGLGAIREVLNQFKPREIPRLDAVSSQKSLQETVSQNNRVEKNSTEPVSPCAHQSSSELMPNKVSPSEKIDEPDGEPDLTPKTSELLGRLTQMKQAAAAASPISTTNVADTRNLTPKTADLFERLARMRQNLRSANKTFDVVPEQRQWENSDPSYWKLSPTQENGNNQSYVDRLIPEKDHFDESEVSEMGGAPIYNLASLKLDLHDLKDISSDREVEEVFTTARSVDSESTDYDSASEHFVQASSSTDPDDYDSSSEYNSAAETLGSESEEELMERERIDSVSESRLEMLTNCLASRQLFEENTLDKTLVEDENTDESASENFVQTSVVNSCDSLSVVLLDHGGDDGNFGSEFLDIIVPEKDLMIEVEVEVVRDYEEESGDLMGFDEDDILTPTEPTTPLAGQPREIGKDVDVLLFDYNFVPIDVPTMFDSLPCNTGAASLTNETNISELTGETPVAALSSESEISAVESEMEVIAIPMKTEVVAILPESVKVLPSEVRLQNEIGAVQLSSETEVSCETEVETEFLTETAVLTVQNETELKKVATLSCETELVTLSSETELVILSSETELETLLSETELATLSCETELATLSSETKLATLPSETELVTLPSEIHVAPLPSVTENAAPQSKMDIISEPDVSEKINSSLTTSLEESPTVKCDPFEALISGLSKMDVTPPISETSESEAELIESRTLTGEELIEEKVPDLVNFQEEMSDEPGVLTLDDGHRFNPSEENWVSLKSDEAIEREMPCTEKFSIDSGTMQDEILPFEEVSIHSRTMQDEILHSEEVSIDSGTMQDETLPSEEVSIDSGTMQDEILPSEEVSIDSGTLQDEILPYEEVSIDSGTMQDEILPSEEVSIDSGTMQVEILPSEEVSIDSGTLQDETLPSEEVSIDSGTMQDEILPSEEVSIDSGTMQVEILPYEEVSIHSRIMQDEILPFEQVSIHSRTMQDEILPSEEVSIDNGTMQEEILPSEVTLATCTTEETLATCVTEDQKDTYVPETISERTDNSTRAGSLELMQLKECVPSFVVNPDSVTDPPTIRACYKSEGTTTSVVKVHIREGRLDVNDSIPCPSQGNKDNSQSEDPKFDPTSKLKEEILEAIESMGVDAPAATWDTLDTNHTTPSARSQWTPDSTLGVHPNNSKISLASLNSESSLQSAGTDGLDDTTETASSEQKAQESDMPDVFASEAGTGALSLSSVAKGPIEQQTTPGKKKRNHSGSKKRKKRKEIQKATANQPDIVGPLQTTSVPEDNAPESHKSKRKSGKKSKGALLVTNLLVLNMGLSGSTHGSHDAEAGAVFLPLKSELASEEILNAGNVADDESDKEIMVDSDLMDEINSALDSSALKPVKPEEEFPESGFVKKNIFIQQDSCGDEPRNTATVSLSDSEVTICAVLKRTFRVLSNKKIEENEDNVVATPDLSRPSETESENNHLPPKMVRDYRHSFVHKNIFIQEDLMLKLDHGEPKEETRILGRRRHNSLGPLSRKAHRKSASPEKMLATSKRGASVDVVENCGHETTDSDGCHSTGSSLGEYVSTPELSSEMLSGSNPKKGKHKMNSRFVRDNVFFRSDTKLTRKNRLDTSTSSEDGSVLSDIHPESSAYNIGHNKHGAKIKKGEWNSIRKSIRAGLKRLTQSKSHKRGKPKAASSTCDLRESEDRAIGSQTGSLLNSLGSSTPCLLDFSTSTGTSGYVSPGRSEAGGTATGTANGREEDAELGHDGTEVVKTRVHLKSWDPIKLLRALYSVRLMDETVEDLSHQFISMEGVMEKLPMGKKKSTLLKTWKRRYFKACDGWLHYYENNNYEKPSHSIQLMGGRVEALDSRILGIDDGRGHYLMLRTPSGADFENWRASLESQTTDNVKAVYVRPVQNSPPHPKKRVLIIDVGSTSIRAGLLGEQPSLPQVFFPMVVAKHKSTGSHVIGFDAYKPDVRENSTLYFPIRPSNKVDKGVNRPFNIDMDLMPLFFEKVFRDLKVDCRSYWVLLSTPQMLADKLKAEFMDILVSRFLVAGVCMAPQSLLAIYSYKATSGIIVDVGERIEILPISDGYIVEKGVTRQPFGGEKVADSLNHALTEKRYRFFTEVERLLVRYVMEQTCYVANSYTEEIKKFEEDPRSVESTVYLTNLDLPGGTYSEVTHDYSCFRSTEGFFNTDLWGMDYPNLHKLVHKAILECPMDNRREMCRSIYLSGGVTMLPGFAERLQTEITKLVPAGLTIQVHASPQRYHAAFIGGCTLASQDVFEQSCISREQWKKNGSKELKRWHMPS